VTVETASYIADLNVSYPSNTDFLSEGDNHITMIKDCLKNTFETTSGVQYDMDLIKNRAERYSVPIGAIVMWSGSFAGVPSGWALCDGGTYARSDGNGNITTPDLGDRFILGSTVTSNQDVGDTGGAAQDTSTTTLSGSHAHANPNTNGAGGHNHGGATWNHTLTIAQIPWHDHGGGSHQHSITIATGANTIAEALPGIEQKDSTGTEYTNWSGTIISGQGGGQGHQHTIGSEGDHAHAIGSTGIAGNHTHTVTVDTMPPYYALAFIMKV